MPGSSSSLWLSVLTFALMLPGSCRYHQQFVANTASVLSSFARPAATLSVSSLVARRATNLTAARSMVHHHETSNVEAAAAALTEAEAMHAADLQLPWWSKLRWRQTSKAEAAYAEHTMLNKLVRCAQLAVSWAGRCYCCQPAAAAYLGRQTSCMAQFVPSTCYTDHSMCPYPHYPPSSSLRGPVQAAVRQQTILICAWLVWLLMGDC
jgi:hypothetical protein